MIPRSIRHPDGRQAILDRVSRLTPQNARQWGRMNPDQLLPHLAAGVRLALGELKSPDTPPPAIVGTLKRWIAIHVIPWPKGRIQAPTGAFSTPSVGWEDDRRRLVDAIERFAATPPDKLAYSHPMFGRMTARDWDVLQYRHIDHHLRQFSA
jgi:hypothetical protein